MMWNVLVPHSSSTDTSQPRQLLSYYLTFSYDEKTAIRQDKVNKQPRKKKNASRKPSCPSRMAIPDPNS